jgi:hypothetical protein
VADILIAVTDGLKGIGEAPGAVFPATTLQTCIVHLIRNSLGYAGWPSTWLGWTSASRGWTRTLGSDCATPMFGAPRTTCCKASPAWAPC